MLVQCSYTYTAKLYTVSTQGISTSQTHSINPFQALFLLGRTNISEMKKSLGKTISEFLKKKKKKLH